MHSESSAPHLAGASAAQRAPLMVLKIDVDTWRGTREGVPNLVHLLREKQVGATFLFSLGPDHTGWAMKRVFRKGFFKKVSRTSVVEHYGIKTLLYGTLLPGPDIGLGCTEPMRMAHVAGFECGIHTWDHVPWHDQVREQSQIWTARQMHASLARFESVFGHTPKTHGAAGWQMNQHAFTLLDQFGIGYASDGRARLDERGALVDPNSGPYRLAAPDGSARACLQMPTTLPTLDEILGREIDGVLLTPGNVADHILQLTRENRRDHVYTLHAELEGQKLAPVLASLIDGWQQQGYRCVTMGEYAQTLDASRLPLLPLVWGEVPGRSGELVLGG
jgi:peptidoglycan/xylan/chitin deacetylase (PgdA/CDA1 family)